MTGWENVVENSGVLIAIAGMTIVFLALAVISGFIALLPKACDLIAGVAPDLEPPHRSAKPASTQVASLDESIAAAIGYAMHLESQRDMTDGTRQAI